MPIDRTPLLAAAAGVGAFLIGRALTSAGGGTVDPGGAAVDGQAAATSTTSSTDAASIDYGEFGLGAGVLQGISQGNVGSGGQLPGGGTTTAPPPTSTPAPTIPGVPKPAGASAIVKLSGTKRLFRVGSTVGSSGYPKVTEVRYSGLTFDAWAGPQGRYQNGSSVIFLRKLLTGNHAGEYVKPGDPGVTTIVL